MKTCSGTGIAGTVLAMVLLAGLSAGCATTRAPELRVLGRREVRAYARRARDPRAFLFSIRMDAENQPVFIDTHRQVSDFTAVIPFADVRGTAAPLIPVRAGERGRTYLALVDTTAAENWTAMDRARTLNLTAVGPPILETEPGHVEDSIPGLLSVSPVALLDALPVEAVLFFARAASGPLWPLSRVPAATAADAVLGVPFLRSFAYVQWDFPARTLVFSAVQGYEPERDALLASIPVVSYDRGIEILASLDGAETRVLIDTAGDFAVAMENPAWLLLPQLRLDELVARQIRVVPTGMLNVGRPDVPRIGLHWLSSYRVTLDNLRGRVYIESP